MRLYREQKKKSSGAHQGAMEHLQHAHQALKKGDPEKAQHHIGHALKAVQGATPKAPTVSPGSQAPSGVSQASGQTLAKRPPIPQRNPSSTKNDTGVANLSLGLSRLKGLNKKTMPDDNDGDE